MSIEDRGSPEKLPDENVEKLTTPGDMVVINGAALGPSSVSIGMGSDGSRATLVLSQDPETSHWLIRDPVQQGRHERPTIQAVSSEAGIPFFVGRHTLSHRGTDREDIPPRQLALFPGAANLTLVHLEGLPTDVTAPAGVMRAIKNLPNQQP